MHSRCLRDALRASREKSNARRFAALVLVRNALVSAFRTWNGIERWEIFPGVSLHAIGGEQVLLCHVVYEPGTTVASHAHPEAEQVMWIVDGDVTMTVGDETRTLGAGDVVVVNRGIEHELYSEGGLTFIEALAPVLRDHVPDPERDLVLGAQGDAQG